jgi:16S rRNA A1518/A1519 N6-dimethyltransferase RsmA/KsgA/DIM1 with predicted DNA glycosylase/AP lyase activity
MTQKTPATYEEFYDKKLVSIYDASNLHPPEETNFYLEIVKKSSTQKILDIGCGTGLLTHQLAKKGYKVTGVEPSKLMLDIARQKFEPNIKCIEGDALKVEEVDFDMAIMTAYIAQFLLKNDYFL